MNTKSLPSEHSPAAGVLSTIALFGTILSGLGLLLPFLLYFMTGDFYGKLFFTCCFLLIGIERFWFSLFTSKEKNPVDVKQDWTFVAVGYSYTLMMYATLIELYLRRYPGYLLPTIVGFIFFLNSFLMRYWAARTLGEQWAIHVEGNEKDGRHLVRTGPYGFVRHPIYLAAMLEVLGIPLFFNAFYSLLFALLVCIPLIIKRTYFEEKNSVALFGEEYRQFKETTWAYWPLKKGIRK